MARSRILDLAASGAAAILLCAGGTDEDPRFGDEAERVAEERRQAIEAELDSIQGRSWAGNYYGGDGLGVNQTLELAPQGGFVFEWTGCLGLYDRNYGAVVADGGHVRLVPEFKNSQQGFEGIAEELLWVRWGVRSYLVPAKEVQSFCNDVNSGLEPRDDAQGSALLRRDDWDKSAEGRPELPVEFAGCLLGSPLEPRVTAIVGSTVRVDSIGTRWLTTDATIDLGSKNGLAIGMPIGGPVGESFVVAEVVAVEPESATIRVEELEEYAGRYGLKQGMRLTTRPFGKPKSVTSKGSDS